MHQQTKILNLCFLILCCGLIAVNVFQLFQKLAPNRPIGFSGLKFSGLWEQLKEENFIGYVTDLDLKETGALAEYEQAQYILAPAVLDIEHPEDHRYVIINCSTDESAIAKLKELNARPLLRNQFGVILAATQMSQNRQTERPES